MAVRLHRFVLAFATLCAFGASAAASAKDITAQVQADGDLGQRLAAVCRTYCLGNRARANLNQVTVVRTGPNAYWVSGRAALVNHQTVEPTVVFGALYGVSDEFHQYFNPPRSVEALDVVADTVGASLGAGALYAWGIIRGRDGL